MNLTLSIYSHIVPINWVGSLRMALLSELVSTCEAEGLDSGGTLTVFARRLREAGRLSKAGRGRGAAHMTYLDAARFLIACAATDHPERAADAENVFSNLVWTDDGVADADIALTKENAPTLDLALATVLEAIGKGTVDTLARSRWTSRQKADSPDLSAIAPAHLGLTLPRWGSAAVLRVLEGRYIYMHPTLATMTTDRMDYLASEVAATAFEREIYRFRTAKNLTAELNARLLRSVARLIAGNEST